MGLTTAPEPVVFVPGLWLLDSSWDRWATFVEDAGYAAVTPGWPDDPPTVEEAREHPEVFANKSIDDLRQPARPDPGRPGPYRGDRRDRPAPRRGVLPLLIAALKSSSAVLSNPTNRHKAVALTVEHRGPMLVISGELDHQVPQAISHATYQRQAKNKAVTEFREIEGRGHSLTIDAGWREVAQVSLDFTSRFVKWVHST